MRPDELEQIAQADKEPPYTRNLERNLKFVRDRITELRMNENISERELSLDIGKGVGYIQHVVRGDILPSLIPFFQLCERFGLEPQEFFDPDFHSPDALHEAMRELKKLSSDELYHLTAFLKKRSGTPD